MNTARIRIAIASVGLGNVGSVQNMFRAIGYRPSILSVPPSDPDRFQAFVLPGVGSYDHGMARLRESQWDQCLAEAARSPSGPLIMGICLGMQLLCDGSDEGTKEGLGLIPGRFRKFQRDSNPSKPVRVPHMGWNRVTFDETKAPWALQLPPSSRFYFVHSYRYVLDRTDYVIGTTGHGGSFASAVARNRTLGFQFHPEKSHRYGKALLQAVIHHYCNQELE